MWRRVSGGPALAIMVLCVVSLLAACSGGRDGAAPSGTEESGTPTATRTSWAGDQPAPEFPPGAAWLNTTEPVRIADLRGKAVLLDFWTLGCINCQHIIPDLKRLEAEFGNALVVIGVHSGKYHEERDAESIREAIARYGLTHPVVNDPDFAIWDRFGARAWPTLVLIDPAGNLVGGHAGEGVYDLFQPILRDLLAEFEGQGLVDDRSAGPTTLNATTPATVLAYPAKAVSDASGKLYVADAGHNRIVVVAPDGSVERTIGSGAEGLTDGPPESATFRQPQGLALSDDEATLYVADTRNHAVRAVSLPDGPVSTIAGTGVQLERLPADGADAVATALASPWDVLVDGSTLYVAMAGVHQLWALDLDTGTVRVLAGTSREGIDDGDPRSMATLAQPSGLASDDRFLYWVDPESSSVRRVPLGGGGAVETLAGTGLFDFGYADGERGTALLQHPQGIVHAGGVLYIADTYNHRVRTLDLASGRVGTLAGGDRGWADGTAADARFAEPSGIALLPGGDLLVADQANHLLRRVRRADGSTSTITLGNPAAAGPGRLVRVDLRGQTVAPGASWLRLTVRSPRGHHLNSLAPSVLEFTTTNPAVVELAEPELRWESDDPEIVLPIPAVFAEGVAEVVATGTVYYCRTGEEALCFIQRLEIHLPVRVLAGAPAGEVQAEYVLPDGG